MQFVALDKIKQIVPEVDGRNWVYPQKVKGRFTNARDWLGVGLIALFVGLPLIRINDLPLLLFDIPNRRFVLFGNVFWPHDLALLLFMAFAFLLLILFVTALAGRVWCGYTCPQTVYLHTVFLKIEQWIEGDRNQQRKLDAASWDGRKIAKKLLKHGIFLVVSAFVAHVFLAYFMDVKNLAYALVHPGWEYRAPMTVAAFVTLAFYVDFAFLREQFCNYICPYARFQSALLDRDSLIVAYDRDRGEPRGKITRDETPDPRGDCVDCHKCVVVCPQGIDIREGLQLECIHCARCIDACDSVMTQIGRPTGLIRYASENELESDQPIRPLRARTAIYGGLTLAFLAIFAWQVTQRTLVEATLLRPPGPPYTQIASGEYANHFRLRLINKSSQTVSYTMSLDAPEGWRMITPQQTVAMASGEERAIELFLVAENGTNTQTPFSIRIEGDQGHDRVQVRGTAVLPQ